MAFSPETYLMLKGALRKDVDDWLSEHVDPETGYVLDDSLTLENAAAQAKAVGDALADVQTAVIAALADKADKSDVATSEAELLRQILASFPTDSISNAAVASFSDGADGIPVKSLTVNITPVQSGSGDPSPSNPRAISGWTGANIVRAGKNILPFGIPVIGNAAWTPANTMLVKSGTYTVSFTSTELASWRIGVKIYSISGTDVGNDESYKPTFAGTASYNTARGIWGYPSSNVTAQYFAVTFPRDCRVAFCLWGSGISAGGTVTGGMLEIGDNSSPVYEAYNGTTYPISWADEAGTVYGGTLTDNGDGTWTLILTHIKAKMKDLTWTLNTAQSFQRFRANLVSRKVTSNIASTALCTIYPQFSYDATAAEQTDKTFKLNKSTNEVDVRDDSYSTLEAFTESLGNDDMIVYLLDQFSVQESAYKFTLTAESVKTLLGQNNIFADCGDVAALTYRADPTLFINGKVAALTAAIAAVLPDNPSTDGAYVLTDTVSSGEATLSWEAGE